MTVQRLREYLDLVRLQRETEVRIAELRTRLGLHAVSTDGGGGGGSDGDKLAVPVARIIELEEQLSQIADAAADGKSELIAWIQTVDDVRAKRLLMLRYYDGKSWSKVANQLGVERNTAQKLHTMIVRKYCE